MNMNFSRWTNELLIILFAVGLSTASPAIAQQDNTLIIEKETGSIIVSHPPNNLSEPKFVPTPDDAEQYNMFKRIIDEVAGPYSPLVNYNEIYMRATFEPEKKFRVKFILDAATYDWKNTAVNANASQTTNSQTKQAVWSIQMYGALYRRPEITNDGFALVVCHELGHHFGGFPYRTGFGGIAAGVSTEGQADYFATHTCLRNHWRDANNAPPYQGPNGIVFTATNMPETVVQECQRKWRSNGERLLCQRIAIAGFSVATLWGKEQRDMDNCGTGPMAKLCEPDFATPDPNIANPPEPNGYGSPQCRLDTYFNGSLCTKNLVSLDELLNIPGKYDWIPANSKRARADSNRRACTLDDKDLRTIRPLCWDNPGWP